MKTKLSEYLDLTRPYLNKPIDIVVLIYELQYSNSRLTAMSIIKRNFTSPQIPNLLVIKTLISINDT